MSDTRDGTPLFCPVCDVAMTSKDDDLYFRLLACCKECGMTWAEINRHAWTSGWRPSQEEVDHYLLRRRSHIFN